MYHHTLTVRCHSHSCLGSYELILVALSAKPDWFIRLCPNGGKVPMLMYGGEKLTDSSFIMQFVDQLGPASSSLLAVCGESVFKQADSFIGAVRVDLTV